MNQIFFPFDKPFLESTANQLIKIFDFDMSKATVVLSGSRSQRRLIEILTEKAEKQNKLLSPPKFFTPKKFCDTFSKKYIDKQIATIIEQTVAWINAARKCEDAVNSIIVNKNFINERDFFRIAQLIMPLHKTLSGEGLSIKKLSEHQIIESYYEEKKRWDALAEIENEYHNELKINDLIDPYLALTQAISTARDNNCQFFENLFVINVIDSFKLFKQAIETQQKILTIFSLGEKPCFDNFGFLNSNLINSENLNFKDCTTKFFNTPNEQAKEITNIISINSENYGYGDFVIAAPDTDLHLSIEQTLNLAGLNAHNAAGTPFNQTELGTLFSSLASCCEEAGCETESFLSLIKHPVTEEFIIKRLNIDSIERYDKLIREVFSKVCSHKIEYINKDFFHFFDDEAKKIVELVFNEIINPLLPESAINEFPGKINSILEKMFSAQNNLSDFFSSSIHQDAVESWLHLTDEIENAKIKWNEKCNAKTAINRFLLLLKNNNLIPKSNVPVIDITGWLEISLDDSPITIIAGFNEGIVPEKFSADAFLPNTLREKLELPNYNKRFLRDKYLTKCLLEKPGKIYFLAGKYSSENEPLKPSKILFCQNFEGQMRILRDFYVSESAPKEKEVQSTKNVDCNRQKMSIEKFLSEKLLSEVLNNQKLDINFLNTLSVSAVNDYLSCPFKFFLKRVCKIYAPDEFSAELSALDIGNLIHEIINENLSNLHSADSDEQTVQRLVSHFEIKAEEKFGNDINPAILIQLENLKRRLTAFVPAFRRDFAEWEPAKDDDGNIIAEYKVFPEIELSKGKVKINGKVDLIERRGELYRVVDFKTGKVKSMYAPQKHKWKDVQLILYALWVEQKFNIRPETGFFNLPSDIKDVKYTPNKIDKLENPIEDAINEVKKILEIIIDENIPLKDKFVQTEDTAVCRYCDFKHICER